MKSPLGLLRALLNDLARLEPSVCGLDLDYSRIKARVEHEGFGFVSVALPSLGSAIDYGLSSGRFTCPPGFSKPGRKAIPNLFSGMLREVFDSNTGLLLAEPSISIVKCLREVCYLFKKTLGSDDQEEKLDIAAKRTFWRCDDLIKDNSFERSKVNLIKRVTTFLLPNLEKDLNLGLGRHGPGAVEEGYRPNQKWAELAESLQDLDGSSYGFEGFQYLKSNGQIRPLECPILALTGSTSSGVSRLVSVPKNSTSRRTITVEPMLRQFEQQRLNRILRDNISRCGVLSRCLDLTDQVPNQKLAEIGSRTGEWATIDLSSASDLLDLDLVKLIFSHREKFLDELVLWRSPRTDKGGMPSRIRKFAGMGNATTFPVQSITFAVLCIAAMAMQDGCYPSYRKCIAYASQIRVFGDDIIVRSDYALTVVDWLTSFGLKVNRKKSFLGGNFKESCGVDAFKGYNVTPVYLRRWPDVLVGADVIASVVSTCNQLWMRCLYDAANYLKEEVERSLRIRLPLVSSSSGAIGLHSRVDAFESHGWDKDTQQLVSRVLTVKSLKRPDKLDGYGALLKFYHTPLIERDDNHLSRTPWKYHSKIVRTWMPTRVSNTDDLPYVVTRGGNTG